MKRKVRKSREWRRALAPASERLFQHGGQNPSRCGGAAEADVPLLSPCVSARPCPGPQPRFPNRLWGMAGPTEQRLAFPPGHPHGHWPPWDLLRLAGATAPQVQGAAGRDACLSQQTL